ncbi:2Fe-2S ferredoxin-like superfamily protein [Wolffia australiana]
MAASISLISAPIARLPRQSTFPRRNFIPNLALPRSAVKMAYKVTVEMEGERRTIEVDGGESILDRALEEGMDVPHDCKLGVCMTCPARLISGAVDQSEGMLSDDVVNQGYALLCVSYPRSDCTIRVIDEEELLPLQLATADD